MYRLDVPGFCFVSPRLEQILEWILGISRARALAVAHVAAERGILAQTVDDGMLARFVEEHAKRV